MARGRGQRPVFLALKMETAWNNKDAQTCATFWHRDLQMIITDLKTRKNFTVDYDTFVKSFPERMNAIGVVRFSGLKIRELTDSSAKIYVNLRKPDRDYPNYFNLVKNETGSWQVISNEIVR